MIGDKRIIDIGLSTGKSEIGSLRNLVHKEWKAEHGMMHSLGSDQSLTDDWFPPPEYFIQILENSSLKKQSIKSQRKLVEDIANLNVCLRCASDR